MCVIALLTLVMTPVLYFNVVPSKLQENVALLATSKQTMPTIHKAAIGSVNSSHVGFSLSVTVLPWTVFPVYGSMGPMDINVATSNNTPLFTIIMPQISGWLNQPTTYNFNGTFNLTSVETKNLAALVKQFSTQGLQDFQLVAEFVSPVSAYGLQMYSALPFSKTMSFGTIMPDINSLIEVLAPMAELIESSFTNGNITFFAD